MQETYDYPRATTEDPAPDRRRDELRRPPEDADPASSDRDAVLLTRYCRTVRRRAFAREALLQGVFRVDSIYHDIREYFAIIARARRAIGSIAPSTTT